MRVAVLRERMAGERRVALVPESIPRLIKLGCEVVIEAHAGEAAGFPDATYTAAGARIASGPLDAVVEAPLVLKVQPPAPDEVALLAPRTTLVSLLPALTSAESIAALQARSVTALALERVPRLTRTQSMDVLSSQATVAGYKAVLLGASTLPRLLPMLTTAAGSLTPGKVLVIGAGVAGLQAIATAKRLGAMVSAFDVRPAAREQVLSLGATFVSAELTTAGAEAGGGYARAQTASEQQQTQEALSRPLREADLVVATASVPGKRAPLLIPESTVDTMKRGSIIVDLAAESGGNCALTKPDQSVITTSGVTVLGPTNLAASMPLHASQMFSRNLVALMQHLMQDGRLVVDRADEITGPMCATALIAAAS